MAQLSCRPPDRIRTATSLALDVAGAESTVALYLSQLGHRVEWLSRLGCDPFGDRISDALAAAGVGTRWVQRDAGRPTGVYFKDPTAEATTVYYYRSGSAASALTPQSVPGGVVEAARWVHITGITPALSAGARALVDSVFARCAEDGVALSFDVNYRAKLWPSRSEAAAVLRGLARRARVVFVGRDEAEALWDLPTAHHIRDMLPEPAELVVKDGAVGAWCFGSDAPVFVPAEPVDVVEPVGAGDAFAAGYLHETLQGAAIDRRLRAGHRLAAAALATTSDFVPPRESVRVSKH